MMKMMKALLAPALILMLAIPAVAGGMSPEPDAEEILYHLTVPWPFKDRADSDGDGVPDGLDMCADTPAGATVNAAGCCSDSDGDGVPDGIDQCDGTPAGATVNAEGCPSDSDGDGVPDGIDMCDGTPAGATVNAEGCPVDSDGDGVPDGLDMCDGTPADAVVDANGCVEARSAIEMEFLDTGLIRSSNILFSSSKADIDPASHGALDEIGAILEQWPALRVEIGGHSDGSGAAAFNQRLSEGRAAAVLAYLAKRFPEIRADQYEVKGYGESEPIADNDSAEGRRLNRRVEFKVLNREALKREAQGK